MPDNRLCRKVFCWDIETSTRYKNTWFNNIKTVLNTCNLTHLINYSGENISTNYVLETVKSKCVDDFKDRWSNEVRTMPKLRTYKTFKSEFSTEPYVKRHLSRVQRSALARIRSGTFPPNLRTCSGSIEDETLSSSIVTVILMHETDCYGSYLLFTLMSYLQTKPLQYS
ncbi:unnamed protein product [Mytilus edulis]|uniref:Uncharacterized protein n=1 Tax=Mytilus edulis TaxID=6550 RepID=A0A8S3TBK3_MYTED|nr:unnamed protein product [Mytilus edulis]